jgi:NAD(P)-dependent dehydrogenase (short-subunit alcohol dehydrogenase family)
MSTAFVTGGNRGLGKALVETLAAQGFMVYAGMRTLADSPFDNELIQPVCMDVQNDASIESAAQLVAKVGTLDILINNAGTNEDITPGGKKERVTTLKRVDRQALLAMFDINAVGPLLVAKYFVPLMTRDNSFIINISSDRALFSNENTIGNYGYRASKIALNMFTQCLLFDIPHNINTFAVHPGWVKTGMNPRGVITPAESAQKILSILDSWQPSMNGAFLDNDGSLFPL